MATCERCGERVTERGHRHRVTVRVPIKRVVEGVACDSFERVTVVVDVMRVDDAVDRAVARVHGRGAFWWPHHSTEDRGQVMRRIDNASSTSVTGRVPAPVVEWDGGDL